MICSLFSGTLLSVFGEIRLRSGWRACKKTAAYLSAFFGPMPFTPRNSSSVAGRVSATLRRTVSERICDVDRFSFFAKERRSRSSFSYMFFSSLLFFPLISSAPLNSPSAARKRSPYFFNLKAPMPWTSAISSSVRGRRDTISSRVASENTTKGGTCSSRAMASRSPRSFSKIPLFVSERMAFFSTATDAMTSSAPKAKPSTGAFLSRTISAFSVRCSRGDSPPSRLR